MTLRHSTQPPVEDAEERDWTVALAASEVDDLVLVRTLDHLNVLTPPSRTLTVIGPDQLPRVRTLLARRSDHVLQQPATRNTGFGLYVALAMIRRWAPRAIVTIVSVGSQVAPVEVYVERLVAARRLSSERPDQVIVWSTSSAYARLDTLWELGRETQPQLLAALDALVPLVGTSDEDDEIDDVYRAHLSVSFARDMIARAPRRCLPLAG